MEQGQGDQVFMCLAIYWRDPQPGWLRLASTGPRQIVTAIQIEIGFLEVSRVEIPCTESKYT